MKTLILIGNDSNQIALASAISQRISVTAMVIRVGMASGQGSGRKNQLRKLINVFFTRIRKSALFPLNRAWFNMLKSFEGHRADEISGEVQLVRNINDAVVFELVERLKPNLVLVSGTNLLSKKLIQNIRKYGEVLNLHTGLSPFINGGPNCTNWCLYLRKFNLIGNTVMYIDEGIDSGDILATDTVDLSYIRSLSDLHIQVMESAHELYLKAIEKFIQGGELPRVSQANIQGEKHTFYSREWSVRKELIAAINFWWWRHFRSFQLNSTRGNAVNVFPIESSSD